MAEVEKHKKGGKGRKRTGHTTHIVIENLNKPSHAPTRIAPDPLPDDDDLPVTDGARAMAEADAGKSDAGNPYQCRDYNDDRVSEPLTAGHQAPSTGDHGPGAGRNQELAAHFLDLRQSTTAWTPLAMLRSRNGDDQNHDRDITHPTGTVNVGRLDAASAAGATGPLQPSGHPAMHGAAHIARNSPIAPNGSHGLTDPLSHAVAVKASPLGGREAMALLKQVARDAVG